MEDSDNEQIEPIAPDESEQAKSALSSEADFYFKVLTKGEATELGIEVIDTETHYTLHADLVLIVPEGLSLENTMFDFMRSVNVVEFKSENDHFGLREYLKNETRTTQRFLNRNYIDFTQILNVFVVAREPKVFFKAAETRGLDFTNTEARPWLWQAQIGFQDVVVVVCRQLPIESRYKAWLAFAPSDTKKWSEYIVELLLHGNTTLLKTIFKMRAKEVAAMLQSIEDEIENRPISKEVLTPEVRNTIVDLLARFKNQSVEETMLEGLSPEQVVKIMTPKKLMPVFTPEERVDGLTPEQQLTGLTPEQQLTGLTPEQIVIVVAPERLTKVLTPEQLAKALTLEQLTEIISIKNQEQKIAGNENKPQKDEV